MPYFPPDFDVTEAVTCGRLIDQAYRQFTMAKAAHPSRWTLENGYTLETELSAMENFVPLPIEIPAFQRTPSLLPFGFIASQGDAAYLVIRGTQTPLEWFDDASIQPVPFNAGWGNTTVGFMAIHRQIFPEIYKHFSQRAAPPDRLFITGHSLGAALAKLAVADLAFHQLLGGIKTIKVYTFSGPRVGDSTFAAKFRELGLPAWRVFNTEDLVPTLPLSTLTMDPRNTLGLFESKIEMLLKLFLKETPYRFQHVDEPVAVTYQLNTIPDNHNLTSLYQHLQKSSSPADVVREATGAARTAAGTTVPSGNRP
ncbi:MAG TPA: lipase family protein [Chthoniobacterales bacterium]